MTRVGSQRHKKKKKFFFSTYILRLSIFNPLKHRDNYVHQLLWTLQMSAYYRHIVFISCFFYSRGKKAINTLNITKRSVFVNEKQYVYCETGTVFTLLFW
jgi:hypothetical protein